MILRRALAKPLPEEKAVEALSYRIERMVTLWQGADAPAVRREPTHRPAGLEF